MVQFCNQFNVGNTVTTYCNAGLMEDVHIYCHTTECHITCVEGDWLIRPRHRPYITSSMTISSVP